MVKKLKSIKCLACKGALNGTMQRWLFTGKDKPETNRGRGKIMGTCTKCGYCIG